MVNLTMLCFFEECARLWFGTKGLKTIECSELNELFSASLEDNAKNIVDSRNLGHISEGNKDFAES